MLGDPFFSYLEARIDAAIADAGFHREGKDVNKPFVRIRVQRLLKEWVALELVCSFSVDGRLEYRNIELSVGCYIEKTDNAMLIASRIPQSAKFDLHSSLSARTRSIISCPPMSIRTSDASTLTRVASTEAFHSSKADNTAALPVTVCSSP